MTNRFITNAKVVTADEVVSGTVAIRDGDTTRAETPTMGGVSP